MDTGLGINFSFSTIMSGFVFGVVGLYLFKYGRRDLNYYWVYIGMAMMAYPLFVENPWLNWGIGFGLSYLAYEYR